jgi:hypothetical protein
MIVQDYLRNGGTLEDLAAQYAIKATRGKLHPNLVSLKYDQIHSPFAEPLVRECRGVVLDEADNWACVARGFDKFFNYGEGNASEIDWSTAQVQEKVDGSLCMLYFYDGEWRVATSGTPDASGSVSDGWDGTFAGLFWNTWEKQMCYDIEDMPWWASMYTWLFELTTPHNRIVVPHDYASLTLLAVRHSNGDYVVQEYRDIFESLFQCVRHFPLTSFEEIAASFATINPLQQEGYVVVDRAGKRVKVKHPQYVALHHLKDGASTKGFIEVIRRGEVPELLTAFPELQEEFERLQRAYDGICLDAGREYERLHTIPTQKEFALEAVKTPYPAVLFALRNGKVATVSEFFATCNIDHLMKLLPSVEAVEVAA